MSYTLTVPADVARSARRLAARIGTDADHVLLEALRAHFPLVPDGLEAEFAALERASDEDFASLEDAEGL